MTDDRSAFSVEVGMNSGEVHGACETQGPGKRSTTLGQLETTPSIVEPGAAPRQRPSDVHDEPRLRDVGLVHHEAEKNRP